MAVVDGVSLPSRLRSADPASASTELSHLGDGDAIGPGGPGKSTAVIALSTLRLG